MPVSPRWLGPVHFITVAGFDIHLPLPPMTTSMPNHARTLGKLGSTLLRAAALALATLPSAWAYSSVELTVGGTRYTVAFTQQRTYNHCILRHHPRALAGP